MYIYEPQKLFLYICIHIYVYIYIYIYIYIKGTEISNFIQFQFLSEMGLPGWPTLSGPCVSIPHYWSISGRKQINETKTTFKTKRKRP